MVATRTFLFTAIVQLVLAVPSPATLTDRPSSFDSTTCELIQPIWYRSHPSLSTIRQRVTDSVKSLWPSSRSQTPENTRHATTFRADQLVLRFNITTDVDAQAISEAANTLFLDVWDQSEDRVDIRLANDDVSLLLGLLPSHLRNSHTALYTGDELARAIHRSYPSSTSIPFELSYRQRATTHSDRITRRPNSDVFFDEYRSLSVIVPWMRLLQSLFSSHVSILSIGSSYEGRDIPALRVGVHPTNNANPNGKRKTILITGGLHAREWVSTSTVNYVAYSLITSYGRRKSITRLLEEFDFVFVPTLNPDGYEYTWTTDRLFRKNRQPTSLRFCRGLDLDRTYPYMWDGNVTGSADNPCSEGYAGSEPLEAVETRAMIDWARNETLSNNVVFVGLLDLHSYSQQILFPYSYSCDVTPSNFEDLAEMASGLAKAIRTRDHENYRTLSACGTDVTLSTRRAGNAAGGSLLDWFYHEMHIHHAFQVKLRDKGSYGFLLPSSEIVPTGIEMTKAVEHFGRLLGQKYGAAGFDTDWEEDDVPVVRSQDRMFAKQNPLQ